MNINKMKKYIKINAIKNNGKKATHWQKGILKYAFEILENCKECEEEITNSQLLERVCLKGTRNWYHYSESGRALSQAYTVIEKAFKALYLK